MARVTLRFRVDFPNGFSVGPGKIRLLQAIDEAGSISGAARLQGLSYRRAWMLVKDLNDTFVQPVTSAMTGGRGGGGVALTAWGRTLVQTYQQAEEHFESYAAEHMTSFATALSSATRSEISRHLSGQPGGRRGAGKGTRSARSASRTRKTG